jgi:hypothetical protein
LQTGATRESSSGVSVRGFSFQSCIGLHFNPNRKTPPRGQLELEGRIWIHWKDVVEDQKERIMSESANGSSGANAHKREIGEALGRIPSGVFIATAEEGSEKVGMLASWVQQAGFDPPTRSIRTGNSTMWFPAPAALR